MRIFYMVHDRIMWGGVCEHFVKNYEKFGKPLTLIF